MQNHCPGLFVTGFRFPLSSAAAAHAAGRSPRRVAVVRLVVAIRGDNCSVRWVSRQSPYRIHTILG